MEKRILKIFFLIGLSIPAYAQKKIIQNDSYKTWTSLGEIKNDIFSIISNNGKYVVYKYGTPDTGDFFSIQNLNGNYKINIKEHSQQTRIESKIAITEDSKKVLFMIEGDSLGILTLGTANIQYVQNVLSFELPKEGNGRWCAYMKKNKENELVVLDLYHDLEIKYEQVKEYKFDNNGSMLLIRTDSGLNLLSLAENKNKKISSYPDLVRLAFDNEGKQLVFINRSKENTEIGYYKKGMDSAITLISNKSKGLKQGMVISDYGDIRFTPDGNKLFILIKDTSKNTPAKNNLPNQSVAIWSYKDNIFGKKEPKSENFVAISSISNPRIIALPTPETILVPDYCNNYVLSFTNINMDEFHWKNDFLKLYLISLKDGTKKEVMKFTNTLSYPFFSISPSEKFVIWMDNSDKQYYTYEIATSITRNISKAIDVPLCDDENDIPIRRHYFGVAGWRKSDRKIWVYDRYDIWELDPLGEKTPVNVTKGLGRKENLILRKIKNGYWDSTLQDTFLLSGFNAANKKNGFFQFRLNRDFILDQRSLGDFVYYGNNSNYSMFSFISNNLPQKAKGENIYIVKKMSANKSPNLFFTDDFILYEPISNIHPENEYNWLTTELINWKVYNGKSSMGILYKPEDFDSTKKYPLIFHYYEKRSDELNQFKDPGLSFGDLNIPWYVSHGYLVFVPDMQYETGNNAMSITNTITSAVEKLKEFPWIDTEKMGLQGHSFGGYETFIIITHTNLFKAAQASAGISDLISEYSFIIVNGTRQTYYDYNQPNTGTPPWNNPNIYLKNSPIFRVPYIETPLLIMHNKDDDHVAFHQSVELFAAMRRLNKPAWLLSYDQEWHWLHEKSNQLDFSIKQQQFFDHYLKETPMPDWMK